MMSSYLRAYIELRGYGARGPRYRVRMNKPDGLILIDATTEPLFDAARALLSRGIIGKLQIWDSVRPYWRMQGDIERLASLTVSEGQDGITLRRYVARAAGGDFEDDATQESQNEIGRPGRVLHAMEAA